MNSQASWYEYHPSTPSLERQKAGRGDIHTNAIAILHIKCLGSVVGSLFLSCRTCKGCVSFYQKSIYLFLSGIPPRSKPEKLLLSSREKDAERRALSRRLGRKSRTNGVRAAGTARHGGVLHGPCMRARSSHPPPTRRLARSWRWCRSRVCRRHWPNHAERRASVRGGR